MPKSGVIYYVVVGGIPPFQDAYDAEGETGSDFGDNRQEANEPEVVVLPGDLEIKKRCEPPFHT